MRVNEQEAFADLNTRFGRPDRGATRISLSVMMVTAGR